MGKIYDMAKHYYQDYTPPLWGEDRLDALVAAGKLTLQEKEKIMGGGE